MQKRRNKSTQKVLEEKNSNQRTSYDRKCHTPSILNQKKKSKPKQSKQKLSEKKINHSLKNIKADNTLYHMPVQLNKNSPFKHKNRPISNLSNIRHVKHIQSQLANLSQSLFGQNSISDSNKKRYQKECHYLNEGKKCMKNNNFQKGIQLFKECLHRDQNNLQGQYLLGVCHFHLEHYEQVIKYLSDIIIKDQSYRKNVYLFLAISYKKVQMIDESLLTLSKALNLYPKYTDVLILRAKILSKQKRYYDAIEDLTKAIKYDPKNIQSYISKADCLRNLTQYKQALKIYSQVLSTKFDLQILLKRAITYIQNDQTSNALADLNKILTKSPQNSQAFLFKGLAFSKQKNYNESLLSYEQAIKFNSSKKATTKALYQIAKLKIDLGDYYGASYTLQRASSLDIDMKVIQKLKTFTDGATFIMKKKYKRGIELLNILNKKQHLNQQIRGLVYAFRSYGNFCLTKFASALSDLKQMGKAGYPLDSASEYNLTILEGIIHAQNNQFQKSIQKFIKAQKQRRQLADPQLYKALAKISEYNRTPKLRNKNLHLLSQALDYITIGIKKQDNFNYYYICAVVNYSLNQFEVALQNIQKAIQRSDDHVIKHYYLRAMIKAMMEQYKEAFIDLNNVLQLTKDAKEKQKDKTISQFDDFPHEKQILQTYLNRSKCYLLFNDKKKAFQDLQTYISQKPLDSEVHTIAGRLLFSIGACQDAVKAYNYSPNIQKNTEFLLQRAKCYILLKQLNLCLKDMEKLVQLGDVYIGFDIFCLGALKEASKGTIQNFRQALKRIQNCQSFQKNHGQIFSLGDMYFYKGVFYFLLQDYQNAKKFMIKSKNLKTINQQLDYLIEEGDEQGEYQQNFQNKIFTDKQLEYNIALCDLMKGNTDKAMQTLKNHSNFDILSEQNSSQEVDVDMTPFPTTNRLCSIFPDIQYNERKRFKLSFCLPTVSSPPIKFNVDYKIIEQLNMASIQCRPDAPWIKRNKHGVVFTDQLIGTQVDVDMDTKTQQQQEIDKNQQIRIQEKDSYNQNSGQKQKNINYQQRQEIQEDHQEKIENFQQQKKRLKQMFALDKNVQDKLNKMMKK